jgi:formylglycine-generating enzyme required for sulfatase activity
MGFLPKNTFIKRGSFLYEKAFILSLILQLAETILMSANKDIIELRAILPTHWVQGQPRTLTFELFNMTDAALNNPQITICWDALEDGRRVKTLPSLPPHTDVRLVHLELTPMSLHSLMEIFIATSDGITGYELGSDPIQLSVLPCAQTSQTTVNINPTIDVKVSDNGLYGAKSVGDSSGINIGAAHVHLPEFENPQERQMKHITTDPTAVHFRKITLKVKSHSCWDFTNFSCISLVGISPGQFDMGASGDDVEADKSDEMLRRNICIPHNFWMGQFPVTQKQYREVMQRLPEMKMASFIGDNNPVVYVSWHDAVEFCHKLNELENAKKNLSQGFCYRLPTEAEWEYSCRAGSDAPRYGPLEEVGAVAANRAGFGAAGRFPPNDFKLYDMLGLVFEWCADAYAPYRLRETSHPFTNGTDDASVDRVTRGGCFQGDDVFARASARASAPPDTRSGRIGFRVVLAPMSTFPSAL